MIRTISDMKLYNILNCPFCSYTNSNIKYRSDILRHIKKCDEHELETDDIEDDEVDENGETVRDYLNWRVNIINTIKKFIRTNELNALQNQTPEEIRVYITNKLLINIPTTTRTDLDAFWIYMQFFEMNKEEDDKLFSIARKYAEIEEDVEAEES